MKKVIFCLTLAMGMFPFVQTLTAHTAMTLYNVTGTLDDGIEVLDGNQKVIIKETNKNLTAENLKAYISSMNATKTMADGEYNMVLTKNNSRVTQSFIVKNNKVTFNESNYSTSSIPYVSKKNGVLAVNCFLGTYGDITVRFIDPNDKVFFEDTYFNVFKLHQAYDLAKIPFGGAFRVEVKYGDQIIKQEEFVK